ncbi:MAG: histidine phosphatase family protein, partial [Candidatus Saccharimonadales bacterium]
ASKSLADVRFEAVYSSDLQRAIDTAELVSGQTVPLEHQLPALRERSLGIMEGKSYDDYLQMIADNQAEVNKLSLHERWRFSHYSGFESDYDVAERFITALAQIAEVHSGQTILVAAHGGTLRATLLRLGYAAHGDLPSGSIQNTAYIELDFADGEFTIANVSGVRRSTK